MPRQLANASLGHRVSARCAQEISGPPR